MQFEKTVATSIYICIYTYKYGGLVQVVIFCTYNHIIVDNETIDSYCSYVAGLLIDCDDEGSPTQKSERERESM